jgi:hypothetical protein
MRNRVTQDGFSSPLSAAAWDVLVSQRSTSNNIGGSGLPSTGEYYCRNLEPDGTIGKPWCYVPYCTVAGVPLYSCGSNIAHTQAECGDIEVCTSRSPTSSPTDIPTDTPTYSPTDAPTDATPSPTADPGTDANEPTQNPTKFPTESPTQNPTKFPTDPPTTSPTASPTQNPTAPTIAPTATPTNFGDTNAPTNFPTDAPTTSPTNSPTDAPTNVPTDAPTALPTKSPTPSPTDLPTDSPTPSPTDSPTDFPTKSGQSGGSTSDNGVDGNGVSGATPTDAPTKGASGQSGGSSSDNGVDGNGASGALGPGDANVVGGNGAGTGAVGVSGASTRDEQTVLITIIAILVIAISASVALLSKYYLFSGGSSNSSSTRGFTGMNSPLPSSRRPPMSPKLQQMALHVETGFGAEVGKQAELETQSSPSAMRGGVIAGALSDTPVRTTDLARQLHTPTASPATTHIPLTPPSGLPLPELDPNTLAEIITKELQGSQAGPGAMRVLSSAPDAEGNVHHHVHLHMSTDGADTTETADTYTASSPYSNTIASPMRSPPMGSTDLLASPRTPGLTPVSPAYYSPRLEHIQTRLPVSPPPAHRESPYRESPHGNPLTLAPTTISPGTFRQPVAEVGGFRSPPTPLRGPPVQRTPTSQRSLGSPARTVMSNYPVSPSPLRQSNVPVSPTRSELDYNDTGLDFDV